MKKLDDEIINEALMNLIRTKDELIDRLYDDQKQSAFYEIGLILALVSLNDLNRKNIMFILSCFWQHPEFFQNNAYRFLSYLDDNWDSPAIDMLQELKKVDYDFDKYKGEQL